MNWHQQQIDGSDGGIIYKDFKAAVKNALAVSYKFSWNKWKKKSQQRNIIYKKNQEGIIKLKNTVTEAKYSLNGFSNRVEITG